MVRHDMLDPTALRVSDRPAAASDLIETTSSEGAIPESGTHPKRELQSPQQPRSIYSVLGTSVSKLLDALGAQVTTIMLEQQASRTSCSVRHKRDLRVRGLTKEFPL